MRIVYELKRDAIPNIVLNSLYKYTQLQDTFNVNNIALVHGRPMMLNLRDLIRHYVDHRHDVIVRKTKFELREAEERAHILQGLLIALDNLDAVITLIRASKTPDEARTGLMESFGLTEIQAKAILDLRLQKLTGLEEMRAALLAKLERHKHLREELFNEREKIRKLLNDEAGAEVVNEIVFT